MAINVIAAHLAVLAVVGTGLALLLSTFLPFMPKLAVKLFIASGLLAAAAALIPPYAG